jgi:hypothetical protein
MSELRTSTALPVDEIQGTMDRLFLEGKQFPERSMQALAALLNALRSNNSRNAWETIAKSVIQPHAICLLTRRALLANRAFYKPRGYAGDAVMIDLIYDQTQTDPSDEWLCKLDEWMYQTQPCKAVRSRRKATALAIDGLTPESPRILSFACGHLREASDSVRVANRDFSEFVAVDQDTESLAKVDRDFGRSGILPRWGTVGQAIRETETFGRFDFIYATGLYDYLTRDTAEALTAAFCRMLSPGGKVMLVNFAPTLSDIGWMEGVMDWWLIYRSPEEMEHLAPRDDPTLKSSAALDDLNALAYLTVMKSP